MPRLIVGGAGSQTAVLDNLEDQGLGNRLVQKFPDGPPLLHQKLEIHYVVAVARMRRQLTQMLERGYVFWPLKKLVAFRNRGLRIPPFVTAITFDDGFAGVYANAWPLLREFGLPATVFVNTAYLDSRDPMPFDHWGLANWKCCNMQSFLEFATRSRNLRIIYQNKDYEIRYYLQLKS